MRPRSELVLPKRREPAFRETRRQRKLFVQLSVDVELCGKGVLLSARCANLAGHGETDAFEREGRLVSYLAT